MLGVKPEIWCTIRRNTNSLEKTHEEVVWPKVATSPGKPIINRKVCDLVASLHHLGRIDVKTELGAELVDFLGWILIVETWRNTIYTREFQQTQVRVKLVHYLSTLGSPERPLRAAKRVVSGVTSTSPWTPSEYQNSATTYRAIVGPQRTPHSF